MKDHHPDTAEGISRAAYPDCAAPHCGMPAQGYSRYCDRHRGRANVTGDPHGRILTTRKDLGPYFAMADEGLARYADHAAVGAALAWCDDVIAKAPTVGGKLGKELQRIRRDGGTGRAMLRRVLAVFGYAHFQRRTWTNDLLTVSNAGHHALLATPIPRKASRKGNLIAQQFSGPTALDFGRTIRAVLGLFAQQFWERQEKDLHALDRDREAINQHLRDCAL